MAQLWKFNYRLYFHFDNFYETHIDIQSSFSLFTIIDIFLTIDTISG